MPISPRGCPPLLFRFFGVGLGLRLVVELALAFLALFLLFIVLRCLGLRTLDLLYRQRPAAAETFSGAIGWRDDADDFSAFGTAFGANRRGAAQIIKASFAAQATAFRASIEADVIQERCLSGKSGFAGRKNKNAAGWLPGGILVIRSPITRRAN
jgi:hypothetical protein